MTKKLFTRLFAVALMALTTQISVFSQGRDYLFSLTSAEGHGGDAQWVMKKAGDVTDRPEDLSTTGYKAEGWATAIVPGTVLNSLVNNGVYPEPYYGLNNKITSGLIPDLAKVGRDFYTYWFRTEFDPVKKERGERIWMQIDGVNYRAEFWLNGKMVFNMAGMFRQESVDVTDYINSDKNNVLAVKVYPIDEPGVPRDGEDTAKEWGATSEFRNGGNGEIGKNVTMLMTVGWDFTFLDGIRDRNTGIWRDIRFFKTRDLALKSPFVKSELSKPGYDRADQTISVEVKNPTFGTRRAKVKGEIIGEGITFEKDVTVLRGLTETVEFTAKDFPQLSIENPRLWWPINKGPQNLYTLSLKVEVNGVVQDSIGTRFGIREITSNTDTPDKSRTFYINGKPIFIKGTNWIPENMLRN